ncbi:YacL family protein [Salinibius halmophilus]|uniref:YacL family protein n=1 Tax=Salinibius halmophilus TaxID=1853216 RepID=UPI000E66F136|nr:YacL family protein [Salinibius halmophilus]
MDYQIFFDEDGELNIEIADEQQGFKRWLLEDMRQHDNIIRSVITAIENQTDYQYQSRQFKFRLQQQEATLAPVSDAMLNEEAEHLGYQATSDEFGCGGEDLLPLLEDWLTHK